MFGFGAECPHCSAKIGKDAKFCPECGKPVAGGKCPSCGGIVSPEARFCPGCGGALNASAPMRENVAENRWTRTPDIFAARIESENMESLAGRRLLVEPGCRAMIFQSGKYMGILPPGDYEPKSLIRRVFPTFSSLFKADAPSTAVLLEDGDIEVRLNFPNLKTRDYQQASAELGLLFQINDPEAFFTHLMRGRAQMSRADLTAWLGDEIRSIVGGLMGLRPAADLTPDASMRQEAEEELRLEMGASLKRWGLELIRVRFVNFSCPEYDKLHERGAAQDVKKQGVEISKGDVEILEDYRKNINQRVREIENREAIHKVQTEQDFKDYVTQLEHETGLKNLMRREELSSATHDFGKNELARQLAFERLKIELQLENMRIELKLKGEIKEEELERGLRLERMKLEGELSNIKIRNMEERQRKLESEQDDRDRRLKEAQTQADIEKIQIENRKAKSELGLLNLERLKEMKRRDEREKMMLQLEAEERRVRLDMESKRSAAAIEKEMLTARSGASLEALIASSTGADGQRLADFAAQREDARAKAAMSAEQLLALASSSNPEAARALAEKFKSEGTSLKDQTTLLREMLDRQNAQRREESDRLERMMGTAMAQLGGAAIAGAGRHDAAPVMGVGPGGAFVAAGVPGALAGKVVVCAKCRAENKPEAKFCERCGEKM
ncbi:MAG: zinc ribbon domain-containing protein [Candidatus Sumerlaeota bacterium]|nr:zinc ribbon domain-containing protein [Candidatus Sumerlaeota bacterium]